MADAAGHTVADDLGALPDACPCCGERRYSEHRRVETHADNGAAFVLSRRRDYDCGASLVSGWTDEAETGIAVESGCRQPLLDAIHRRG